MQELCKGYARLGKSEQWLWKYYEKIFFPFRFLYYHRTHSIWVNDMLSKCKGVRCKFPINDDSEIESPFRFPSATVEVSQNSPSTAQCSFIFLCPCFSILLIASSSSSNLQYLQKPHIPVATKLPDNFIHWTDNPTVSYHPSCQLSQLQHFCHHWTHYAPSRHPELMFVYSWAVQNPFIYRCEFHTGRGAS